MMMTNVPPVMDEFKLLSTDDYMKWLERAEILHEKGYFLDVSVHDLAEKIFNKDACEG